MAHNHQVAGSNPAPATKKNPSAERLGDFSYAARAELKPATTARQAGESLVALASSLLRLLEKKMSFGRFLFRAALRQIQPPQQSYALCHAILNVRVLIAISEPKSVLLAITRSKMGSMLATIPIERMRDILEGVSGESRILEFKEGFVWKRPLNQITAIQAKTIKTLLAMANTPQGGTLVIGVEDDGKSRHNFKGVNADERASFTDTEGIARQIDSFALEPIEYQLGAGKYHGKEFVVFTVSEFKKMPVLCAKDLTPSGHSRPFLSKLDLYTRSSKSVPETVKAGAQELRDIITMVEERDEAFMRKFIASPRKLKMVLASDVRYASLDRDL